MSVQLEASVLNLSEPKCHDLDKLARCRRSGMYRYAGHYVVLVDELRLDLTALQLGVSRSG